MRTSTALSLLLSLSLSCARAQAACDDAGKIYRVCSDQGKILDQAAQTARAQGQLLILVIGAEWCPWCVSLHGLLKERYEGMPVAEIALYREHDRLPSGERVQAQLMKGAGLKKEPRGIPQIVVYDPKTQRAVFIDTGDLEQNTATQKGHDPAKVAAAVRDAARSLR